MMRGPKGHPQADPHAPYAVTATERSCSLLLWSFAV